MGAEPELPEDRPTIVIRIWPEGATSTVKLYVTWGIGQEVLGLARAEGLVAERRQEFSNGPLLESIAVAVLSGGTLYGIARVITAIAGRHKDKRVTIDGVEVVGYKFEDAQKLLKEVDARYQKQVLEWKEQTSRHEENGGPPGSTVASP